MAISAIFPVGGSFLDAATADYQNHGKMKKMFFALLSALAFISGMKAQTFNVVKGSVTYAFPASRTGIMPYLDGEAVTIMGKTFNLGEITQMYVDNSDVADNSVIVAYNDTVAKVTVAGNIANYVTPSVTNAHVSILQSQDTGDDTCGEITYTLSGASTNGGFSTEGSYKATIELAGLTLNNPSGAPLNIQNGKRINLSVKKNTENTLADGSTTLATFTVPSNYSSSSGGQGGFRPGGSSGGSSVLISCAGLTSGNSYTMTSGSSSSTVTATLKGSGGGRW